MMYRSINTYCSFYSRRSFFFEIFLRVNFRECERLRFSRIFFVLRVKKKCLHPPRTALECPLLRVMRLRSRAFQPEAE